jgi:hypothetical protein
MMNAEHNHTVLGADVADDGLVALTDAELGLVLGGNESDVTGMIEHVRHVGYFVAIGGALAGPDGAAIGLGVGVAVEVVEHAGEELIQAAKEYQNNPPPI